MKKNEPTTCPICVSPKTTNLLNLNCGNLDNSPLYQFVKINACVKCGHIYNSLSANEIKGLVKYYNEEYAPINLSSTDKLSDLPGSENLFTLKRYSQLYRLISPYINADFKVLDVGCAIGGFLNYLNKKGIKKLYGIDVIKKYIDCAKKEKKYIVKTGNAESIPFTNKIFNLLIMDQVVEHLINPRNAFREAKRVLTGDGLLCIGIPDASKYNKIHFFDFFWFLMREHIQHFDIEHLKLLAEMEGFEMINFNQSETPMVSDKMILPNLNVIFRLVNKKNKSNIGANCFEIKRRLKHYVKNELKKLGNKKKIIKNLIISRKPLYVWGIGREFLYLYESAGLKKCNVIGFIDANPYKQKKFFVNDKKITDESVLKKASANSALMITAFAHAKKIKKEVLKIGYKGKFIKL